MGLSRRIVYLQEAAAYVGLDYDQLEEILSEGLLEVDTEKDDEFLLPEHLDQLRRMRRLKEVMDTHWEGIEIILRMRDKIIELQKEVYRLKSVHR